MYYLGIDNGSSGAIAVLRDTGAGSDYRGFLRVDKMPPTDAELLALLQMLELNSHSQIFAVLEFAQVFPKMGVTSAGSYMGGYRAMQMGLLAAGIPFDIVVPRKWQSALSCSSGGDKNVTKRRAEQLFPMLKITHAIADALLMAEYCRRFHGGLNGKEEGK